MEQEIVKICEIHGELAKDECYAISTYYRCKQCDREKKLAYYAKKKDIIAQKSKDYYYKNIIEAKQRVKTYREKNKNIIRDRRREDYQAGGKEKERALRYREKNLSRIKERSLQYRMENKEKIKERGLRYYSNNKEIINKKGRIRGSVYRHINREKITTHLRELKQKARQNLLDLYIKDRLRSIGFSNEDITVDLIEVKRLVLKLGRQIKESRNER